MIFKKKDKTDTIFIVDEGINHLKLFDDLCKSYPYQRFIYFTDLLNYPYKDKSNDEVNEFIRQIIELANNNFAKCIIFTSHLFTQYKEQINKSNIKCYFLFDEIINYVNTNYNDKDIALLEESNILINNNYNKQINYNIIYSVESDNLIKLIENKMTKTQESFEEVKTTCKLILDKKIDLLLYTDSRLDLLKLEFKEYLKAKKIIDFTKLFTNLVNKDKKKIYHNMIYSSISELEFTSIRYFISKYKYSYVTLDNPFKFETKEK